MAGTAVQSHTPGRAHTFFAIFFAWAAIFLPASGPLPMSV